MAARRRNAARAAYSAMQKGIDTVANATAKLMTIEDEPLMRWVFFKISSNVQMDRMTEKSVAKARR